MKEKKNFFGILYTVYCLFSTVFEREVDEWETLRSGVRKK
jgi:hypothetical protein